MWTNKQVWEFEEINENLTFDMLYVEPGKYDENLWKSKSSHLDSDVRDVVSRTFDNLWDDEELWITSKGEKQLDEKFIQNRYSHFTSIGYSTLILFRVFKFLWRSLSKLLVWASLLQTRYCQSIKKSKSVF